jgi:hypothetical protein
MAEIRQYLLAKTTYSFPARQVKKDVSSEQWAMSSKQ